MSHTINEATGEVTVILGGETIRLKASFGRMADLQTAIGKKGLQAIFADLGISDMNAVRAGLACLGKVSAAKLDDMNIGPNLATAISALLAAITLGMPRPEEDMPEGENLGISATLN